MKDYKWKVSEKETGLAAMCFKRHWPVAYYKNEKGSPAAWIECVDAYNPGNIKTGKHGPLTLKFADHSKNNGICSWTRMKLTITFKTLQEAKEAFENLIKTRPHIKPIELR